MIISFPTPSTLRPVGGAIALYHFANALSRRGHDVRVIHLPLWGTGIAHIDEIDWFRFEPAVTHWYHDGDPVPPGDIVIGTGDPYHLGRPVLILQGINMLHLGIERSAIRTPALRLCVASWLVDVGVAFGVERDQFAWVPCGIDHDVFQQVAPLDERPVDVAVLVHHHEAKGWPVADAAIRSLLAGRPGLTVEAFGANEPHVELPPGVVFHRTPDHRTLADEVYNRAKVFLQASWYEGFGFTAVEAMACGAALVTTDNGGSRDYAFDGDTALVASRGDHEGLARRIESLLDDAGTRIALAQRGAAYTRNFDWDHSAGLMEAAFERYLADPDRYLGPPGPDLTLDEVKADDIALDCLDRTPPPPKPRSV